MKIRDKIREIYRLYQECDKVFKKHGKALSNMEDLCILLFDVLDRLAISYFGNPLGMVISCYCYHNYMVGIDEDYTVNMITEATKEVVEWYRDTYDSEVEIEEVVKELKKKLEREEELERRTEMLERFYDSGGYKSVGNVSSEEIIVGLEKMMEEAEAIWGSK